MSPVIHIREPFYSAGKKYGWEGKRIGLGFNLQLLQGSGNLRVMVGDSEDVYFISKEKALSLVKRYNSIHKARSTFLGIVPWHAFDKEPKHNVEQPELFGDKSQIPSSSNSNLSLL